jgi:hypothetical protein
MLYFQQFSDIVEDHSCTIMQEWITDLNDGCESSVFRISDHTYPAHSLCPLTGKKLRVSRSDFDTAVTSVKGQCRDAAEVLIAEFDRRFPDSELMNALSIVFS